jgi:hypothetical protein
MLGRIVELLRLFDLPQLLVILHSVYEVDVLRLGLAEKRKGS